MESLVGVATLGVCFSASWLVAFLSSVFVVLAFVSIISSSKQTILVLASFFCRAYYPSYRNHLHWESNPGQFFGVLVFVSVISSSKQTTLVFAPFFYRA
jgi:hypothetical protein